MRPTKWLTVLVVVALCLALALTGCATKSDASYPSEPIEYVVHSSAGGSSDIFTRTIADFLTKEELITVPFTVVNKTGGGGAVAYQYTRDQKAILMCCRTFLPPLLPRPSSPKGLPRL